MLRTFQSKITRFIGSIFLFLVVASVPAWAQLDEIGAILEGGTQDANLILERYLTPLNEGLGEAMNSGWNTSAKPHKLFGFHLKVGSGLASVPGSKESFSLMNNELQNLQITNPQIGESATVFGSDSEPTFNFDVLGDIDNDGQKDDVLTNFTMPEGIDFGWVPAPTIQAGIGLIKSTEINVRFIPETDLVDDFGSISSWGIGLRHGINSWIPAGKLLPVDITLQGAYSVYNLDVNLDVKPRSGIADPNPQSTDGQSFEFETKAWNVHVIVGKNLPIISPYVGVGYASSSSTYEVKGNIPITSVGVDPITNFPRREISYLTDPIDFDTDTQTSLRGLVGLRIRLAIIAINAEYTLSEYSVFNAGIGISFR